MGLPSATACPDGKPSGFTLLGLRHTLAAEVAGVLLIGIDPLLGPECLAILRAMGHGDLIALVLVPGAPRIVSRERFAFYDLARSAYALLATGERAFYGNPIIRKGVLPPPRE